MFDVIESVGGLGVFIGKVVIDINNLVSIEIFLLMCEDSWLLIEVIVDVLLGVYVGKVFNMV